MQIQFAHPYYLLLALPFVVHAIWMARRLQALSRVRRSFALTLRLLIIMALFCVLAGLRVSFISKELTVYFVVDDSDSVPEAQKDYAKLFIQKAHEEMGPNDKQWIIMFGSDAAIEQTSQQMPPEFDAPESLIDGARTNIASAIQLAVACASGDAQKRIVLLTDGNQNAGSIEVAARTAAAAGISIDVVPLKYENRNDIILEKAIVENRVSLDEPFDITVIATTRENASGKLSVHQDGQLLGQYDIELKPDQKNSFTIPTEVRDAGYHRFEVQIDADGDAIPENNRGFAFTYGEGEPRVLLVDGDIEPSLTLAGMLKSERINIEVVPSTGLPHSLRSLQMYDAIVFNNVPAADLSKEQMQMLEYAVSDLGMGFLMIGGQNSFGAGGYNDSPIERILPVDMEIKNEKILPQGALVPIVHTVEIPEGQYWAEQILHASLDVLSPRDQMGVLQYSWEKGESWLFPLQEVGRKSHLRAQLKKAQWGDMPSFDKTIQMAYDSLVRSNASVKHIVVISDGDPQTPNWGLVKKVQAAKITISTICINPHSPRDAKTMQDLARIGGGNFYYPKNYKKLPQIFIKEAATVRKSLIFEEPFIPKTAQYSPVLVGFQNNAYPQLLGYVGTSPKDAADTPLVTQNDDPLFAHWRHGLGKTVAFTSDAKEQWAKDWVGWEQYSKFWAQTIRWALRSPFNRNFQVQMEIDGSQGKVLIDAVDDEGEFRNFLAINGNLITPALKTEPIEFRQVAPGRYEASFDVKEAGTYMFGAQAAESGDGENQELLTGGTTLSYSPEFRNSSSNQALLYRITDLADGRILDEKSQVFFRDRTPLSKPNPLWPQVLTILLALFLLDIFVRRVIVGWSDIAAGTAIALQYLRAKLFPKHAVVEGMSDQLLKVKETALDRPDDPDEPEVDREEFLESLKRVKVESSPFAAPEAERQAPPLPPKAAKKKAPAEEESNFTSQLLKARSKAKKRMDRYKGD